MSGQFSNLYREFPLQPDYKAEARDLARRAIEAIRSCLYDGVRISCWNAEEVSDIKACLPPDILPKVGFSWYEFVPPTTASTGKETA